MSSLFANLFSNVKSAISLNTQGQEFTADFNGESVVKVRFSVADMQEIRVTDEVTVEDVIRSAAKLGNVDLTDVSFTVLQNGTPVELTSKFVNGATYKISRDAGTAG